MTAARTRGPDASSGPGSPAATPSATAPARGSTPAGGPPATGSPAPGVPAAAYHQAGATNDPRGDAGATTPAYGDLISVTIEDDGTNARVTVRLASTVPGQVPADEVLGVGVDFYRSSAQLESDYQLFADGQPDGWYAYLQTPRGFVKYPGTFGLGGDRLVFTVPWSALGSPRSGGFSAFADWTRGAAATNLSGEDHAPDLTNAAFSR